MRINMAYDVIRQSQAKYVNTTSIKRWTTF